MLDLLMKALLNGQEASAEWLIEHGASVKAVVHNQDPDEAHERARDRQSTVFMQALRHVIKLSVH